MNIRPPRDGKCPACGANVETASVENSKHGRCVVLWPCRDVYPIDDLPANRARSAGHEMPHAEHVARVCRAVRDATPSADELAEHWRAMSRAVGISTADLRADTPEGAP